MERLLADATKLTGVKYDISNLDDVYSAIHAVQEEMGITGTTAKESAETFSGSLASMKGAFANVLGGITLGQDIQPALKGLAETTSTFLFKNFIPMVGNILKALPGAIVTFVKEAAPLLIEVGSQFVGNILNGMSGLLPNIKQDFSGILTAVTESFQNIIAIALPIFTQFVDTFKLYLGTILENVAQLFSGENSIVNSIVRAFQSIIDVAVPILMDAFSFIQGMLSQLVIFWQENGNSIILAVKTAFQFVSDFISNTLTTLQPFITTAWENIKTIFQTALDVVLGIVKVVTSAINGDWSGAMSALKGIASSIWEGIKTIFSNALNLVWGIVTGVMDDVKAAFRNKLEEAKTLVREKIEGIKGFFTSIGDVDLYQIGKDVIQGLINGIGSMVDSVGKKISEVAGNIKDKITGALGIHSPSRWMRDQVGKNISKGIAVGIGAEEGSIFKSVNGLSEGLKTAMTSLTAGLDMSMGITSTQSIVADTPSAIAANSMMGESARFNSQNYSDFANSGDDLGTILRAIEKLAKRPINTSVQIDGREVAQATSHEIDKIFGEKTSLEGRLGRYRT